jgi:SecD/SecF fusion protein
MNFSNIPSLLAANSYRIIDYTFPSLISGVSTGFLICLGLIAASFALGILVANAYRQRDYGWKLGLILSTVLVSTFVILFGDFKLGVDLKGGVILVYGIDEIETKQLQSGAADANWNMGQLIAVLTKRLNPTGLKEIVIRPFGNKEIEIVVPEVDPAEIERIKETIRTGGVLQFMIVASDVRDAEIFEFAKAQSEKPAERLYRAVMDDEGKQVGYWAKLAREEGDPTKAPFRSLETLQNGYVRDSRTGEVLDLTPQQKQAFASDQSFLQSFLQQRGTPSLDVLMVYDPDFPIRGDDLAFSYTGHDESFRPAIHFTMTSDGSIKMGHVTQENLKRPLAIIFDTELLSAPTIQSKISDNGQITGNFTQEEVDFVVGILKSGSMPVVMQKNPVSENQIGSILGQDTVQQGSRSILIATGAVFAFMIVYYRTAGLIASFALALNLSLTVAIMVALQAPFTLPGLAGLVLTLAMSVDANVLISERMREELAKGATLRMAIRNGFDKALSAIVDGNLTTFLTALVLYSIGTDQIKGFGMTLMLGNITSMFTAIFCARVILEFGERSRWIKSLSMTSFLTNPQIDWVRFFGPAVAGSAILVLIGIVATVARGKGLFDIDLAGGTSVTFILKEPMPVDQVRANLDKVIPNVVDEKTNTKAQYNAYELSLTGGQEKPQTVYKIDSSLEDVEVLKAKVREALRTADGKDLLKTYHVDIGSIEEAPVEAPPVTPSISAPNTTVGKAEPKAEASISAPATPQAETKAESKVETKAEAKSEPKTESPPETKAEPKTEAPAEPKAEPKSDNGSCGETEQDAAKTESAQPEATKAEPAEAKAAPEEPKTDEKKAAEKKADPAPTTPPPAAAATTAAPADQPAPASKFKSVATLNFPNSAISAAALKARIQTSAKNVLNQDLTDIDVDNKNWDRKDNSTFENWKVTLPVAPDQAKLILNNLQSDLNSSVVWQTSSQIGGQVPAHTQLQAVGALTVSLLGIVAYVWFRFQRVAWGLAAVAALAHDALVMLTAIALSYWVAGPLGFLGVEEFKISLPVVAAFLTILGYSVNDTIVIFDRLREIRGKNPNVTRQMLNDAVNQTLSRNIILAGITLTVVIILYAFGGPGIHAFSFALLTGVLSGCYTTLVIAAPMLLWLLERSGSHSPATEKIESRKQSRSVA